MVFSGYYQVKLKKLSKQSPKNTEKACNDTVQIGFLRHTNFIHRPCMLFEIHQLDTPSVYPTRVTPSLINKTLSLPAFNKSLNGGLQYSLSPIVGPRRLAGIRLISEMLHLCGIKSSLLIYLPFIEVKFIDVCFSSIVERY